MKIENEKIIQATEDELYSYWLSRGWYDIYSFPEYMQRMKDAGCEVIAEMPQTVFDHITQSPEVLAHTYIYTILSTDNEVFFCSALLSPIQTFVHLDKAIAATVEKLKEVCHE